MIKRLAAAVLLAMVNLLGSASADASVGDDDSETELDFSSDAQGEYRKASGSTDSAAAVLALLSQACDEPLDAAWIARGSGDLSAAAAATVHRTADHVAAITLAVRADCPAWAGMLGRALMFCRDEEAALKVTVELQGVAAGPVESIAELHGFQVASVRHREGTDTDVVECYTDLYWGEAISDVKA